MQTYLDCYPCLLRQSIEAARMAGASQAQAREVVSSTLALLKEVPMGATPPEIGMQVHQSVREILGSDDPYQPVKAAARAKALSMLDKLRAMVKSSQDPLETAIRLSIAGNIIDFGPNRDYDLWEVVNRVLNQDLVVNEMPALKESLQQADTVLFLGDNAGESVFDRVLIEVLSKPVTYVVRGGPVLNDTTMEDALAVGLDQIAEVIDNGARAPGTILSLCSQAFKIRFEEADLIIAKGMGNYETLSEVEAPIFFLLQVKCPVIAKDIGAPVESTVVKFGGGFSK